MRVLSLVAIVIVGLIGVFAGGVAHAQGQAADNTPKVGVIDMGYIFDSHPTIEAQIAAIDQRIEDAQKVINQEREALLKRSEGLQKLEEGSPDFLKFQEAISQQEADLKLKFLREERAFAKEKATIIFNEYKRIENKVAQWAKYNNMLVVLRYSRLEMDPKDPATVSQGMQKSIVYFSKEYDLTDAILAEIVNESGNAAATTAQNPAATRR